MPVILSECESRVGWDGVGRMEEGMGGCERDGDGLMVSLGSGARVHRERM